MIDSTYVLAALIVVAAAISLALIGIAVVRRFRASRWAEYDISLTERLERALGTGLPPLKVEPRSAAPSVETISTAMADVPSEEAEASAAVVEMPPRTPAPQAPPVPAVPPADLITSPGEVWFTPEAPTASTVALAPPARPRPKEPSPEPSPVPAESTAADYQLAGPVELTFAGDSGVVGVHADTEMAAAFRRMADELTEGIDSNER